MSRTTRSIEAAAPHPRSHPVHNPETLMRLWRRAIQDSPFVMRPFAELDGYPLVVIENAAADAGNGLYISTGIHGDEPAPPWALLAWFQQGGWRALDPELPVTLFPLLNPAGVAANTRGDLRGRDLNRLFDKKRTSPFREIRAHLSRRTYQLAVCLHEDYDGQGIYAYDLNRKRDATPAKTLLKKVETDHMPIDPRSAIDGRRAREGVIFRRRLDRKEIPGLPEAVFLFLEGHAARTLTFETPSEFCFSERASAHVRFLEEASRTVTR